MTSITFPTALRLAAVVATLLQAPAQAGLISGSWDPAFGAALPGLNWAVHAEVLVPNDACTDLTGVVDTTVAGACASAKLQAVFLRLYDDGVAAPDWNTAGAFQSGPGATVFARCDSALGGAGGAYDTRCNSSFGNFFSLSGLRMQGGSVVGLQATVDDPFFALVGEPATAQGKSFSLNFTVNGPELYCLSCDGGPVQSDTTGLRQFLVTYNGNNTSEPKFRLGDQALGVRLDAAGNVIGMATSIDGQLVPEPAGLALVASALAAAALVRRRRG